MTGSVNKVILIGNLGGDPEIRYTQSQQPIANLRIATSERWQDRNTNERREQTEWHRVVCFSRLAEICSEYLHKGSKVYIEGRLQTRSWEGQDGQTRYSTEVIAREMTMLDSRSSGDYRGPEASEGATSEFAAGQESNQPSATARSAPAARPAPSPAPAPVTSEADDDFEDDIPF